MQRKLELGSNRCHAWSREKQRLASNVCRIWQTHWTAELLISLLNHKNRLISMRHRWQSFLVLFLMNSVFLFTGKPLNSYIFCATTKKIKNFGLILQKV